MIKRQYRGLITLNASLLGVLALAVIAGAGTQSGNQPDGSRRGRGIYTMVGGSYTGGSSNAIYIVDAQNQEMVALSWSDSKKVLLPLGYRDLAADARQLATGGRK